MVPFREAGGDPKQAKAKIVWQAQTAGWCGSAQGTARHCAGDTVTPRGSATPQLQVAVKPTRSSRSSPASPPFFIPPSLPILKPPIPSPFSPAPAECASKPRRQRDRSPSPRRPPRCRPRRGTRFPSWLKSLPVAPEFRPTAAEFADPVAYILKIEPAAAPFGICKVVPPHPPPPKRTTLANLTRSFAALHPDDPSPTFPSRHQQLGLCPRRPRPAIKPVWQSSHRYTLPQFEAKAGATRKVLLSHLNVPASRQLSLLDVEALFWCAMADRPVTVEYASDMAGSGFGPCAARPRAPAAAHGSVGDTAWNMRGVARSPGSLLRFLREDVPGVTSPMLYVAMMFSWFAWHVEDHDLHSVNYMHSGAPKTWYGVPGDAALALEDVVRVHGYGGELNSLGDLYFQIVILGAETFAMLGNKTTVMSPEVLVELGIPCCRLVQNAGEFVITFPGAYHSGFSHAKGNPSSVCPGKKYPPATFMNDCVNMSSSSEAHNAETDMGDVISAAGLLDQGSNLEDAFRSGDTGTNGILPPLNRNSALDLLASAYGDHSDPDKDVPNKMHKVSNDSNKVLSPRAESQCNTSSVGAFDGTKVSTSSKECQQGSFSQSSQCISKPSIPNGPKGVRTRNKYKLKLMLSEGFPTKDIYSATQEKVHFEPPSSNNASTEPIPDTNFDASHNIKDSSTEPFSVDGNRSSTVTNNLFIPILKPDKDSSRMHVFCLEHAAEVEKQLQTIGGAHVILLCRPEYPKVEAEARLLSEEMEFDYDWKDIHFREASMEDRKKIQEVVQDEETIPTNSDWAVKLGINLYYSANLAKSPLYKKQLPYNRVIYKAFGCTSPDNSPVKLKTYARRQGRQKKVVLAGRWCGKVWMSNQVHPYLAHRTESHEPEETDEICSDQLDQKQKELSLHKRDICPVKGCRKKFFSHKYLLQHRKVHADARPLKCPWKDCKRTFKWQWARTEHVRVHTGDRPYVCHEPGCEQTFRFVSDFSRHKRRTGHLDKAVKTK
ncbi:hypothetical protein PR202_ga08576 [Eleusine coracana subsp. coracana]|uniref:Lysine-specific demethylase REF6 n=1 Tax=Eleusine coracana subsp. coracana TaxID=191504 RepID=A0AAV5C308_ELECO|nr:hypothetical protein PR202_ga08576 [Eleusine coracana subsp. coracana]